MSLRIMFVVPYVPNLIRVRPYNFIRYLAERGNQITLATLWGDDREKDSIQSIKPFVSQVCALNLPRWRSAWNCFWAVPTRKPLQSVYCWQPELVRQIDALLASKNGPSGRPFDVVHVEHLRGAAYGLHIRKVLNESNASSPPVVWDSVDSISLLFRQAAGRSKSFFGRVVTSFELGRTEHYEGWLVNQFDRVLVTSALDRNAMVDLIPPGTPRKLIDVLRNGVDLDYFRSDPEVGREPATLIISGKMSYHANVTMVLFCAREIMPLVWAHRPDVKLMIVGKDPPNEVKALTENPQVIVTGTVEHLPPYLQRATIALAPIAYGVGIQNKVLEAMACATPVITMPQAVSALEAQNGIEVLVASDPQAFASSILDLISDPKMQHEIGMAGRHYVERHHDWRIVVQQLEEIYHQANQR